MFTLDRKISVHYDIWVSKLVYFETDGQARWSVSNNHLMLKAHEWEAGTLTSLPGPPADFPYGHSPIRLTLPGSVNSSVKYTQEFVQDTTTLWVEMCKPSRGGYLPSNRGFLFVGGGGVFCSGFLHSFTWCTTWFQTSKTIGKDDQKLIHNLDQVNDMKFWSHGL